jgi:hypothetical protein
MAIGRDIRVVFTRARTHSPAASAFLALLGRHFPGQEQGDGSGPRDQESA